MTYSENTMEIKNLWEERADRDDFCEACEAYGITRDEIAAVLGENVAKSFDLWVYLNIK